MTYNDRPLAYIYMAALYHPDCLRPVLAERFAQWCPSNPDTLPLEALLTSIADRFGVNRADENTFDSDEFPRVVWADLDGMECIRCAYPLIEPDENDERCPACGNTVSWCPGHGPMGDPTGFAVRQAHDSGDHSRCRLIAGCPLLEDRPEGAWYLGPIVPAVRLVEDDGETLVLTGDVQHAQVNLCAPSPVAVGGGIEVSMLLYTTFGRGLTVNEGLRYALGAHFGPIDDEGYDEDRLRKALMERES